ncbi:hypothetical protein D3C76_1616340 [compost metagenome]
MLPVVVRLFSTPTETVATAVRVPYLTVIVATPVSKPVTRPLRTSAMAELSAVHSALAVTSSSLPSVKRAVSFNCSELPIWKFTVFLLRTMEFGISTATFTVTVLSPYLAVTTALPAL